MICVLWWIVKNIFEDIWIAYFLKECKKGQGNISQRADLRIFISLPYDWTQYLLWNHHQNSSRKCFQIKTISLKLASNASFLWLIVNVCLKSFFPKLNEFAKQYLFSKQNALIHFDHYIHLTLELPILVHDCLRLLFVFTLKVWFSFICLFSFLLLLLLTYSFLFLLSFGLSINVHKSLSNEKWNHIKMRQFQNYLIQSQELLQVMEHFTILCGPLLVQISQPCYS